VTIGGAFAVWHTVHVPAGENEGIVERRMDGSVFEAGSPTDCLPKVRWAPWIIR